MTGKNMELHNSHDVSTKLVTNDNTGVPETKQKDQNIRKEDLKRAAMQERRRRANGAQVLRCNREVLKMLALRERRNRESIVKVIKHQSTPEVDSESSNKEELKRRALEVRRMRKHDRHNLGGVSLMHVRHQHRGNEKKANVGEVRGKDISTSKSDNKGASLQHNKIDDHNRHWREKQQQKPVQEENRQQLDRTDGWNEKVEGGIHLCVRPPSLSDTRDTSPPADDDVTSEKTATLDDVTSPDIGVGGEHIDTDERAAPMRELSEKLVDDIKVLNPEKNTGTSKSDEEALLITTAALKKASR